MRAFQTSWIILTPELIAIGRPMRSFNDSTRAPANLHWEPCVVCMRSYYITCYGHMPRCMLYYCCITHCSATALSVALATALPTALYALYPPYYIKYWLTSLDTTARIAKHSRAVSSVGQSACSTRRRSLVRAQYRPPNREVKLRHPELFIFLFYSHFANKNPWKHLIKQKNGSRDG